MYNKEIHIMLFPVYGSVSATYYADYQERETEYSSVEDRRVDLDQIVMKL